MAAPTNGPYYDVGTPIALSIGITDVTGVASVSITLDGAAYTPYNGGIDVDSLLVGTHTLVIVTRDLLGNMSTQTITFTVRVTAVPGLVNAVLDGVARGWIAVSIRDNLVKQLQGIQETIDKRNTPSARNNLKTFINQVSAAKGKTIAPIYADRLINWATDLMNRL
jgi:hypothetical protein